MSNNKEPRKFASDVKLNSGGHISIRDLYRVTYLDTTEGLAVMEMGRLSPISVNLSSYGMRPAENCVFIPDYGQHENLTTSLEEAGLVEKVREISFGYGTGHEVKLLT